VPLHAKAAAVLLAAVPLHAKAAAVPLRARAAAVLLAAVLLAAAPLRKLQATHHAFQFGRWQHELLPVVLYSGLTRLKLEREVI